MPDPNALLAWYGAHRRGLPWRGEADPYKVWVSEVMLQQTRAETVVPRYRRFLARFPTLERLAAASEQEVLAEWSGLGYYRRARHLHTAARELAALAGWPRTASGWRRLPGIGDYTAAAVASIAFGEAIPVVDGNVARVMSRLHGLQVRRDGAGGRRRLAELAAAWLDPQRPGDSNQALMELGATVCTPRRPRCTACPMAAECVARRSGNPEQYPLPARQRPSEKRLLTAAVVSSGQSVLLFRRPVEQSLLNGFWELPWVETRGDSAAIALERKYGGRWRLAEPHGAVRHSITHRRLEVEVRTASWRGGDDVAEAPEAAWFDAQGLTGVPISSLVTKALALPRDTKSL
ncbi:MAG: A/G-specific adenine glycosylase [Thermoanaerobaculia bacterium]